MSLMEASQVGPRARPPADVETEAALLGSMMLSRGAVAVAMEMLSGADFYDPAHQIIFTAATALAHREAPIDVATLAAEIMPNRLKQIGGRAQLLQIQAGTPASSNAEHYARIVAEAAAARRGIALADEIRGAAYDGNLDEVTRLLVVGEERLAVPSEVAEPALDVMDLTALDTTYDWQIPDLLERGERVIITGSEGLGKSTFMRQWALQCALGLHPVFMTEMRRLKVLHVDMENSQKQSAREYLRMMNDAKRNRYERGYLSVKARPQGLNLLAAADVRWLEALVEHHAPEVLVIGPLYKMFQSRVGVDKHSEEAAEAVAATLDRIRTRHHLTLLIEAHSPHADGKGKRDLRPVGSSLWLRWPEFGIGLSMTSPTSCNVVDWRGKRDRARRWPTKLEHGVSWPWQAPDQEII